MKAATIVAQQAVVAEPWAASSRERLASLMLRQGSEKKAHSLLSASIDGGIKDQDALLRSRAISLALSLSKSDTPTLQEQLHGAQKMAEKAVVSAPWLRQNWVALACIRSLGATT